MIRLFYLASLLCCAFVSLSAQPVKIKRLADVQTVFVLQESKADRDLLGNFSSQSVDGKVRREQLAKLREVRQQMVAELNRTKLFEAVAQPDQSPVRLNINYYFTGANTGARNAGSGAGFNTTLLSVTVYTANRLLWMSSFTTGDKPEAVAEKISRQLGKDLQKERDKLAKSKPNQSPERNQP